jgi:hypothetical protein
VQGQVERMGKVNKKQKAKENEEILAKKSTQKMEAFERFFEISWKIKAFSRRGFGGIV